MSHQKNLPSSLCHGLQVPNPECQKKKKQGKCIGLDNQGAKEK